MLYPFAFQPIFKERVWGGQQLRELFGKRTPAEQPIGESWEVSDRPGDVSVIANGPLVGKDLHWLMAEHGRELLGDARDYKGRFPLLAKILDAREKLSLQVHPPAAVAEELEGEPKTEMWFVVQADAGAELFVGLRAGVGEDEFKAKLQEGTVEDCFHRVRVRAGDAMFVPSGRVHAIGGGCVLYEMQQNSDTTYRVFDWNRVGLDGKPRPLHVAESLRSIDFSDHEPGLIQAEKEEVEEGWAREVLVDDPLFKAERHLVRGGKSWAGGAVELLSVVRGVLHLCWENEHLELRRGQFALLPAERPDIELVSKEESTEFLSAKPR